MEYKGYMHREIPLHSAERGGNAGGRERGVVQIETGNRKGIMRCSVQGLVKGNEQSSWYGLILFGEKNGEQIYALAGNLSVGEKGSGETRFRFDPLNFDGKGNALETYSLFVVASQDKTGSLIPVLVGRAESTESHYDSGEGEEKPSGFVTLVSGDAIREKEKCESQLNDVIENQRTGTGYNSFYNKCLLRFCKHTCRVSGFYHAVTPFAEDQTGAEWKHMVNVGNLPLVSPGAQYFASQGRHYLFGVKKQENGETEQYYFAVPGRNLPSEQPDGGESGFVLWQPIRGRKDEDSGRGDHAAAMYEKGTYGYWILAVNGKTGEIEEPCLLVVEK